MMHRCFSLDFCDFVEKIQEQVSTILPFRKDFQLLLRFSRRVAEK